MADPLDVHICGSGSDEDERLRAELDAHLAPLVREGVLRVRYRAITSAADGQDAGDEGLKNARVVLLLASPDLAAARPRFEVEMKRALDRQVSTRVIVVLLRAHDWAGTPLAALPALPLDGEPVAARANREEAWREVARSLRAIHARGYLGIPAPAAAPTTAAAARG